MLHGFSLVLIIEIPCSKGHDRSFQCYVDEMAKEEAKDNCNNLYNDDHDDDDEHSG